ncbi:ubiquitin-protein ligase TUL1 [Mycosarcoma maydis]|uniref:RING-type E3 ubiquitin transferase n=1 Tax=Mycosarcoma maydis TaxID=5270 RepID=A0A0D1CQ68_MYCMD|nr:ubiquitin-protein ligase TUL1 [Ustilago maydis 521]KIS68778.1 hypothetical protein UMAG_03344 [Ustilago maydis 521]|eukprot:XP_011389735.1 hypothetical protein UMAG_03344 [Ustilago maydis 521]
MQFGRNVRLALWLVLLALTVSVRASFFSTLVFGKDTLAPVRAALRQTQQLRSEVFGWYSHNSTQQANLTVTPEPSHLYKLLPAVYSGRSLTDPDGSYYSDIEGYYKGDWTGWDYSTTANRSLALDSRLNHSAAHELSKERLGGLAQYVAGVQEAKLKRDRGDFEWITEEAGHVDVHLKEEHLLNGNVSLVTGSLSFAASKSSQSRVDAVSFSLEGLHFVRTGSVFLHAVANEADERTDVRTTLSMIPWGNNETLNATVAAIDKAFQLRIDMLQRIIDSGSYDAGDITQDQVGKQHNCSLHVYAQLESAGPHSQLQHLIDTLQDESTYPTGISTISPPALRLSLLAFSPDCHLLLSSTSLTGLLQTTLWRKAVHYAIIYFVILLLQARLLVQQMQATTTPSTLNKLSAHTWLAQWVLDAFACLIHLSVAVVLENETTMVLIACSFMSGMCYLAFGYRYMITIYRTQVEARTAAAATTPLVRAAEDAPNGATDRNAVSPPTEVNAATLTTATLTAEIRARRRGLAILAVGVFVVMMGLFPELTGSLMLSLLYSFWIPQIYRNVQHGTRRAILKRCVVGTTLTRLFLPLYVLVCPNNVLFSEPSMWGWVLCAYVVMQAVVLIGQDLFGAHWFLRQQWVPQGAPKRWQYHPPLKNANELEAGVDDEAYGDCAICLTSIESRSAHRPSAASRRANGANGAKWLESLLFSKPGYQRIAGEAQDYEIDSCDDDARSVDVSMHMYAREKVARADGAAGPALRRTSHTRRRGVARNVRYYVARAMRTALQTALRCKERLNATSTLNRRRMDVMLAPCQHAFHTQCLEPWMEIKNECPSCRSSLPRV